DRPATPDQKIEAQTPQVDSEAAESESPVDADQFTTTRSQHPTRRQCARPSAAVRDLVTVRYEFGGHEFCGYFRLSRWLLRPNRLKICSSGRQADPRYRTGTTSALSSPELGIAKGSTTKSVAKELFYKKPSPPLSRWRRENCRVSFFHQKSRFLCRNEKLPRGFATLEILQR
ncbi:unnamed protein product, partial [Nesidiocoris tenuis]